MNNVEPIQIKVTESEKNRFEQIRKDFGWSTKDLLTYFIKEGIKNPKKSYNALDSQNWLQGSVSEEDKTDTEST